MSEFHCGGCGMSHEGLGVDLQPEEFPTLALLLENERGMPAGETSLRVMDWINARYVLTPRP